MEHFLESRSSPAFGCKSPKRRRWRGRFGLSPLSETENVSAQLQFVLRWRRCMGVEPTLDQEAGRATVLKTAWRLFQRVPATAGERDSSSELGPFCSSVTLAAPGLCAVLQQILQQVARGYVVGRRGRLQPLRRVGYCFALRISGFTKRRQCCTRLASGRRLRAPESSVGPSSARSRSSCKPVRPGGAPCAVGWVQRLACSSGAELSVSVGLIASFFLSVVTAGVLAREPQGLARSPSGQGPPPKDASYELGPLAYITRRTWSAATERTAQRTSRAASLDR
jgi:hypothetical protein